MSVPSQDPNLSLTPFPLGKYKCFFFFFFYNCDSFSVLEINSIKKKVKYSVNGVSSLLIVNVH